VKDNGLGIPAHSHAKVFQVFQRFHPNVASGVGLGLSIVAKIIDRHGGQIDVESTEGVGSAFWILFGFSSRSSRWTRLRRGPDRRRRVGGRETTGIGRVPVVDTPEMSF